MDEATRNQALDVVMAIIAVAALVIGLISVLIGKIGAWWDAWHGARSVKDYGPSPAAIMSRTEPAAPLSALSSLRTDDGRTETTAPQPKFTEDQLLTLYALLRAYGVTRDKATLALKAAGIPVNNNLWTKAAPMEDGEYRTPIAGRPTSAVFETDPGLVYEQPPK